MTDIDLDRRDTFSWLCRLDKASTVMAREEGLVTADVAARVARGLQRLEAEHRGPDAFRPTDYLHFAPLLEAIVGPDSSRIHVGRSRQDILAVLYRLQLRDRYLLAAHALCRLRGAWLTLARTDPHRAVPTYTNGVQAQPTSFGHLVLGYEATARRAYARLRGVYETVNHSPLGAAALATTSFPINRHRLAELLGFGGVVENSFDAAQLSAIDAGADAAGWVTSTALPLNTFIQDLHAQYHHASPWLVLDHVPALTSPSTLMPQKRNPVALNRARLAGSEVLTQASGAAIAAHNVCSGLTDYKRDHARRGVEALLTQLDETTAIVEGLHLDPDAALAELHRDFSSASELANVLQRDADIPFGVGHRFVSDLVDFAREHATPAENLDHADVAAIYRRHSAATDAIPAELPLDRHELRASLDPQLMVAGYRGFGGPQPDEVDRMLESAREHLESDQEHARHATETVTGAEAHLEGLIASYR